MRMRSLVLTMMTAVAVSGIAQARDWHVAPTGTATGDGSLEKPLKP